MHPKLQHFLPQHVLSSMAGKLADCRCERLKNQMIKWFIRHYQVDMGEAIESDYRAYPTFNDFFIRHLKINARPLPQLIDDKIISPVDGCISQMGKIEQKKILQAKNRNYSLSDLLANETPWITTFEKGCFFTAYLAPKDYHRVHMPADGKLQRIVYVPGKLFSVNTKTVASRPNLFTRNERVICYFKSEYGPFALILVGALLVGSIHTVWEKAMRPSIKNEIKIWDFSEHEKYLAIGDECGHFQFGSTVIILFSDHHVDWISTLQPEQPLKMGQVIGIGRKV